ncbi:MULTISPECIES: MFS transporter [Citricoccus]|uniref:MFS transporter n=1 Tax=Citricoccus TaxID=169133 RepID=UPI000255F022|nr:MFS transporter [Citricoccus sp. CH26A]
MTSSDPGADARTAPELPADEGRAPQPAPAVGAGRPARQGTVGIVLAVLAVLFIAANLRPGATSLGPVLAEVSASLGIDGGVAGVLTALPGLMFGVVGLLAVRMGRRAGLSLTIALGLVLVVAGLLLRPASGSVWAFVPLTALALAGMAVGNVLVPAWVKRHGRRHTVVLMTLYSMFLTVGGSAGSGLAAPMAGLAGALGDPADGWRYSLGFWGLMALVPLVLWLVVARRTGHDFPTAPPREHPDRSLTSSPTAVALMVLFGVQAMNAYVQFGWMPQVYRDAGLDANLAGSLTAVIAGMGIIGGLVMPTVIERSRTLAPWMLGFGLLTAAGYIGLLVAPVAGAWLWSVLLGAGGFAFPTAISLIPARSRDPHVTARLSGFVQPFGYILAALGPLAVGFLHAGLEDWTLVLVLLAASGVVMAVAGLRVSGRVFVDDELAG